MPFSDWFVIPEGSSIAANWVTYVLLSILVLATWAKIRYARYLGLVLRGFTENRFVGQLVREEGALTNRGVVLLSVIALLSTGLFAYQLTYLKGINMPMEQSVALYVLITASLLAFSLAKFTLLGLSGIVLNISEKITEYIFSILLFNWIQGLLLLMVVVLVQYLVIIPPIYFLTAGCAGVLLLFLWRLGRMFYGGVSGTSYAWFYIIFYLCTLEILPLVIVLKMLIETA